MHGETVKFNRNAFAQHIAEWLYYGLVCHLTSDQNLEETRNIKCLFPTTKERTTNGQSNLIDTEQKRDY